MLKLNSFIIFDENLEFYSFLKYTKVASSYQTKQTDGIGEDIPNISEK